MIGKDYTYIEYNDSRTGEPYQSADTTHKDLGCFVPVSYTHLDVYKRQTIYSRHNSALAGGFVLFADTSSTKKTRAVQALSA